MAQQPLTLKEILDEAEIIIRGCEVARSLSAIQREQTLRAWIRAFLARWSTLRHLRDLQDISCDVAALSRIAGATRTAAEEEFLRWLIDEWSRHETAIREDEVTLAHLEREFGADLVADAIRFAEAQQGRRIQIEGGSRGEE